MFRKTEQLLSSVRAEVKERCAELHLLPRLLPLMSSLSTSVCTERKITIEVHVFHADS